MRSNKEFHALVFIGRFQPLHKGHAAVIEEALNKADEVIVVVGSSRSARSIRNLWTFEERKKMIKAEFPTERVKVVGVPDYPYDENKWIAAVQAVVYSSMKYTPDPIRIGLIGHNKDHTSYYLNIFGPSSWKSVNVENYMSLNATDIRNQLLIDPNVYLYNDDVRNKMCKSTVNLFTENDEFYMLRGMKKEFDMIQKYKESWKAAPFPPTFVTVDAVVVQSGHLLLVKRKHAPGMGLWALPGGFVNQHEKLVDAAIRELREETRLKVPAPVLYGSIKGHHTFDDPNRSTRGRTITTAYHIDLGYGPLPKVKGSDDAVDAKWVEFKAVDPTTMFEDHASIVDFFLNIR